MVGEAVALDFAPRARLRELTGHDERRVRGRDTEAAIELVDCLLSPAGPEELEPGSVRLVASDRDRILLSVQVATFGRRIDSTVTCGNCDGAFDLDFDVVDLFEALIARGAGPSPEPTLPDGRRIRVPTGADELAVAGMSPERAERALLERCLGEEASEDDAKPVNELLERTAPVLDVEIAARCPECGDEEEVRFDLQSYLLEAVAGGQRRLARDIHLLASAYRWPLEQILALPRSERLALVAMVEHDRSRQAVVGAAW